MKACYNCLPHNWDTVFGPETHRRLAGKLEFPEAYRPEDSSLADLIRRAGGAEVMITTWGALPVTLEVLQACGNLKAVFHAAGSVKGFVTQELLRLNPIVSSAVEINARPVAEFCLGIILSALKDMYRIPNCLRGAYSPNLWRRLRADFKLGYYGSKVGLVGFGKITRALLDLLSGFELDVYVASDHFQAMDAAKFRASPASVDWIFANCDIVSLHGADTPNNWHLANADRLALMKEGSYLLNTARGKLVDEVALSEVLASRDIVAILDVTDPEPPLPDNPLLSLPNCLLTPHISGSIGPEIRRLGNFAADEVDNYLSGKQLEGLVDLSKLSSIA
jgi:phosphoglycerate dehydrogenase-like enzyme